MELDARWSTPFNTLVGPGFAVSETHNNPEAP
jgi:hypothetical protein